MDKLVYYNKNFSWEDISKNNCFELKIITEIGFSFNISSLISCHSSYSENIFYF